MPTNVAYGDVVISRLLTQSVDQVPVFDDSGTDLLYWKYTVKVVGFLQSSFGQLYERLVVMDGSTDLAATNVPASTLHIAARTKLKPRQNFVLSTDGAVLLSALPLPDGRAQPTNLTNYDVDNGPKCTVFRVSQITGNQVFKVEAEFEICKVECDVQGRALGNTKGVLSNRWSAQDLIDGNRRTTRTYTGVLRTAGGGINPQMLRSLVIPPLEPYLRRDTMQFIATADGKSLQYSITDVEVAVGAPKPLTKWDIQHTETMDEALNARGELRIMMEADTLADKAKMVEIGLWLLYGLLAKKTPAEGLPNNHMLEEVAFTDYIGDTNRIEMQARVRRVPTKEFSPGYLTNALVVPVTATRLPGFAGNPGDNTPGNGANQDNVYDPKKNPGNRFEELPIVEGPVALTGLFLAYLQTPCNDEHSLTQETLPSNTNESTTNQPQAASVTVVPQLPSDSPGSLNSQEHVDKMYTFYRMSSEIYDITRLAANDIAADPSYDSNSGPPTATRVTQLAPSQCRRRVRIYAERLEEWPQMPDAPSLTGFSARTGITQHLLKARRHFETPDINAMGKKVYRVRWDATYALSRAPLASEAIPVGRNVWTTAGDISTNQTATDGWS